MPNVSVIVPNYNHARFLEQRLDSILNQTYQDFEVILLDDASTDNSKEILEKYLGNPKISTCFNAVNSGSPFKQWNRGMDLAQGEYIWIAESDDYAEKTLLETLVQVLDQHPSVGIAYTQSWEVDESNVILSTRHYWTNDLSLDRWQHNFINDGVAECQNYLIFKNTIPNASAALFRAKAYQDSRIDNESYRLAGDWLAWVKILMNTDIAYVSQPLNYYRTHAQTARKKTWNTITAINERLSIAEYIQTSVGMAPQRSRQISINLAQRFLNSLMDGHPITQQHITTVHRIARLNVDLGSMFFIYRYIFKQLASQKITKLKSSITSSVKSFVC